MANQYWIRAFDADGNMLAETKAGRSSADAERAMILIMSPLANIPKKTTELRTYRNEQIVGVKSRQPKSA